MEGRIGQCVVWMRLAEEKPFDAETRRRGDAETRRRL
jgi:hypothetical protein